MGKSRTVPARGWLVLSGLFLAAPAGCDSGLHSGAPRIIGAGILVLPLTDALDPLQRPAVEFPHEKHVQALKQEGCQQCHALDQKKRVLPRLNWKAVLPGRDGLMDAYHDTCRGCHQRRTEKNMKSGPVDCGECHLQRPPALSAWREIAFDYSLHSRHLKAAGEKCETCHHSYDPKTQKLQYTKFTESNCRDCHGEADNPKEKQMSWRTAAHLDCINCHLREREKPPEIEKKKRIGPTECRGCHGEIERAAIGKLEKIPRLKRRQPDRTWVKAPGAVFHLVPFDHGFHETQTTACRDCHHRTLRSCQECHPYAQSREGGGINLEQAYHLDTSGFGCVGCHTQKARAKECDGCHQALGRPPLKLGCTVCHKGPRPTEAQLTQMLAAKPGEPTPGEPDGAPGGAGTAAVIPLDPDRLFPVVQLAPLPEKSDDFPDEVVIQLLAKDYQPAKLPHRKIVAQLDQLVRKSKLAARFHGQTEVLCIGCHHHSPLGSRYPACRACHGNVGQPGRDAPDLPTAYHRQCIGCHQRMGQKAQGCLDCHKKKVEGKTPEEVGR